MNHDGNVNITDVTLLISAVLNSNMDNICTICGDFNQDGDVNITDVTQLVAYVNNLTMKLQYRGSMVVR